MYTVILYWQGEMKENLVLNPECYGFLFSYAHIQDQVFRRPYAGAEGKMLNHILMELNWAAGGHSEWRLILFDGRLPASGETDRNCLPPPDTIRTEWMPLLRCVSGEETNGSRLEAVPPREVWYMSCSVRGAYSAMGQDSLACAKILVEEPDQRESCDGDDTGETGDGERETARGTVLTPYPALDLINIPSLRMCWMEILPDGGIHRQQELFRLCCALLVLAHNDISPTILSSGYLYRIGIELDWERLVGSAGELRLQNANMAEQLQKAWEYWRWMQRRTAPYVEPSNLYAVQSGLPAQPRDKRDRCLKRKELNWACAVVLDRKLRTTRQWLHKQLFFPQNDAYEGFDHPVKLEEQNQDTALDAAGQASVQSELDNAIRKFHDRRRQENSPLQFEQKLADVEHQIRDRVEDRLTGLENWRIQKALAMLEGVTFASVVTRPLRALACNFSAFFAAFEQYLSWPGWKIVWEVLLFCAAAVLACLLALLTFRLLSWGVDWMAAINYNKYLNKALKSRRKKRESTFDFIKYILRYRYHWILQKHQVEIGGKKERQKDYLQHHSAAQKHTAAACAMLEQLTEQGGCTKQVPGEPGLPKIDFSKEPEQGDYFWRAAHSQTRGLNGGGYQLDVIFDFITEIELCKTATPKNI